MSAISVHIISCFDQSKQAIRKCFSKGTPRFVLMAASGSPSRHLLLPTRCLEGRGVTSAIVPAVALIAKTCSSILDSSQAPQTVAQAMKTPASCSSSTLLWYGRKSRHRTIKKQRRDERLAATSSSGTFENQFVSFPSSAKRGQVQKVRHRDATVT